jgi:hypothetical protein
MSELAIQYRIWPGRFASRRYRHGHGSQTSNVRFLRRSHPYPGPGLGHPA